MFYIGRPCHYRLLFKVESPTSILFTGKAILLFSIIAVTAGIIKEDLEKCINSGMDDFISKPISAEKIQLLLNHYNLH